MDNFTNYLKVLAFGEKLRGQKSKADFCTFCLTKNCDCNAPKANYREIYDQYNFWLDLARKQALPEAVPHDLRLSAKGLLTSTDAKYSFLPSELIPKWPTPNTEKTNVSYRQVLALNLPVLVLLPNGDLVTNEGVPVAKTKKPKFPLYGYWVNEIFYPLAGFSGGWVKAGRGWGVLPTENFNGFSDLVNGVWYLPTTKNHEMFSEGLVKW